MRARIIDCLQDNFYVTDRELISPVLDPHWLRPQDVAQPLQQHCGVLLREPEIPYHNWGEYINILSRAACRQGVKL
ncbi:MAG: hypothetical protein IJ545_01615 [Alphaproteobacteria bacterium]|nr:hypothetical protein [Alphaproteobacteria bacterium]